MGKKGCNEEQTHQDWVSAGTRSELKGRETECPEGYRGNILRVLGLTRTFNEIDCVDVNHICAV